MLSHTPAGLKRLGHTLLQGLLPRLILIALLTINTCNYKENKVLAYAQSALTSHMPTT